MARCMRRRPADASSAAQFYRHLFRHCAGAVVTDIAFLFEGASPEELPEQCFGAQARKRAVPLTAAEQRCLVLLTAPLACVRAQAWRTWRTSGRTWRGRCRSTRRGDGARGRCAADTCTHTTTWADQ